jgi:hypothetical protein
MNRSGASLVFVIRILGGWCLIAAIMALVFDITLMAQGTMTVTSIGQHWVTLSPGSYTSLQGTIVQSPAPFLWSPVLTSILAVPAWIFLGMLGAALYAIGRRRRPVSVFAN